MAEEASVDLGMLGPVGFRTFFYPPAMVSTYSEIDPLLSAEQQEIVQGARRSVGVVDGVGIVVHPEPCVALVLFSVLDRRIKPTTRERSLLCQTGLHLESAYRLRRRPDVVKGVLSLTRPRRHRTADTPADEALAPLARRIDLSLTKKGRAQHEAALDLWTALIDGRYSLVSRSTNGTRRYLVLENRRYVQEMRALTRREIDVLSMAARGLSTKLVAYGLGLSRGIVSSALSRAASKLGLSTPLELLRLAATLAHDPRSHALPATLTAAETEILGLLREGLSNEAIARMRSRSVRTVANQVASLLQKTKSASRRALIADGSSSAVFTAPRRTS